MPALAPVPPKVLCEIIKRAGYVVIRESQYNWILYKEGITDFPLLSVPKRGKFVALPTMETLLFHAGIDDSQYLMLKNEIAGPSRAS